MHSEAFMWVAEYATSDPVTVLDLGGRDVNGNIKELFPGAVFTVVDILPGEGVDIVADAGEWEPDQEYAYVVCTETFEHTYNWAAICRTAFKALRPGGTFIVTTAGPGRHIHSGVDGQLRLLPYEQYANVPGYELERVLTETGFQDIVVDTTDTPSQDTRSVAIKPDRSEAWQKLRDTMAGLPMSLRESLESLPRS